VDRHHRYRAIGLIILRFGLRALGFISVGIYGAFGLDGLGHYMLALCSEHTFVTNVTLWSEAIEGFAFMAVSAALFSRLIFSSVRVGAST
jgi:hypothetical protein